MQATTHTIIRIATGAVVFTGSRETVQRAYETLKGSFFFTVGTAKPRTDEFPYSIN